MARTFDRAVKDQLGDIVYQACQLAFENEQLREKLAEVTAKLPKPKAERVPKPEPPA